MEGAITRNVPPLFPIPSYVSAALHDLRSLCATQVLLCSPKLQQELPGASEAIAILADLEYSVFWLAREVESDHGDFWSNASVDAMRLVPLIHRCLCLSPNDALAASIDGHSVDQCFSDAIRHTIVLFLAPIRRRFGPPASGTELYVNHIKDAIQRCCDHQSALKLQKLLFWIIAVAAVEACTLALNASWFFDRMLEMCAIVGAKDFDDICRFIEHSIDQSMWLRVVMTPGLNLMMEKFRITVRQLVGARGNEVRFTTKRLRCSDCRDED